MAGKKKKSKSKQKSKSVAEPWSPQIPYLQEGFERAKSEILNRPRSFYAGPLVADFDTAQLVGQSMAEQRAGAGAPNIDAALRHNADVVSGRYLNANPHLQGAIDAASAGLTRNYRRTIAPEIDSSFARAGRYGSGAAALARSEAQNNLAQQVGQIASSLSYQDYGAERDRMAQASALAPELYKASFLPAEVLMQIGGLRQAHQQSKINAARERHDFHQNEPYERLRAYMSLVQGNYGGTTTSTSKSVNIVPGPDVFDQINKGVNTASNVLGFLGKFGLPG